MPSPILTKERKRQLAQQIADFLNSRGKQKTKEAEYIEAFVAANPKYQEEAARIAGQGELEVDFNSYTADEILASVRTVRRGRHYREADIAEAYLLANLWGAHDIRLGTLSLRDRLNVEFADPQNAALISELDYQIATWEARAEQWINAATPQRQMEQALAVAFQSEQLPKEMRYWFDRNAASPHDIKVNGVTVSVAAQMELLKPYTENWDTVAGHVLTSTRTGNFTNAFAEFLEKPEFAELVPSPAEAVKGLRQQAAVEARGAADAEEAYKDPAKYLSRLLDEAGLGDALLTKEGKAAKDAAIARALTGFAATRSNQTQQGLSIEDIGFMISSQAQNAVGPIKRQVQQADRQARQAQQQTERATGWDKVLNISSADVKRILGATLPLGMQITDERTDEIVRAIQQRAFGARDQGLEAPSVEQVIRTFGGQPQEVSRTFASFLGQERADIEKARGERQTGQMSREGILSFLTQSGRLPPDASDELRNFAVDEAQGLIERGLEANPQTEVSELLSGMFGGGGKLANIEGQFEQLYSPTPPTVPGLPPFKLEQPEAPFELPEDIDMQQLRAFRDASGGDESLFRFLVGRSRELLPEFQQAYQAVLDRADARRSKEYQRSYENMYALTGRLQPQAPKPQYQSTFTGAFQGGPVGQPYPPPFIGPAPGQPPAAPNWPFAGYSVEQMSQLAQGMASSAVPKPEFSFAKFLSGVLPRERERFGLFQFPEPEEEVVAREDRARDQRFPPTKGLTIFANAGV